MYDQFYMDLGMKDALYGDFTEFVINGHCTWIDVKDGMISGHDYLKLYIVTTKNGIIVSHMVSTGRLCTYACCVKDMQSLASRVSYSGVFTYLFKHGYITLIKKKDILR